MIKKIVTNTYRIEFDTDNGLELTYGINGNPDPEVLEFPSLLDIGIMGHCPNKCSFCYQDHIYEPHMSLDDFMKIIDQVKDSTNQVALGGRGDPNLHPSFKEIIEYCRKNNIIPNYTTSGINLTDEQIEISKQCGAVAVSAYDKSFTFDAIRRLTKNKILTNIHMIGSKNNYSKICDILVGKNPWKLAIDIDKIFAVIFLLFKKTGAGKHLDQNLTIDQISNIGDLAFQQDNKRLYHIGFDSCFINHFMNMNKIDSLTADVVDYCESSRKSAYISPAMELRSCSFSKDRGISLKENTLKDAWNSELFQTFRKSLLTKIQCPLNL